MCPATHELAFDGKLLSRGFWLYIWEITASEEQRLYYVGRTGDSSSLKAQSPFNRLGQHLGFKKQSNALRRHLELRDIKAEECHFRLISYGPIMEEALTQEEHRPRRDRIAAAEKALADAMIAAGYNVTNPVNCRKILDSDEFVNIRAAFAAHFPKLNQKVSAAQGAR